VESRQVRSDEARTHFRDLLDAAEQGEHITILRYEKPVAIVVPVAWYEQATALIDSEGRQR
jgi:prevent-host-death family protein